MYPSAQTEMACVEAQTLASMQAINLYMRYMNQRVLVVVIPRLRDTAGCQTGCQTGLTTG